MSASSAPTGFLADRLHRLPAALTTITAVYLILLGLALAVAGARSLHLAAQWGKERGNKESRPYLGGGLGGIAFGSVAFATTSITLTLFIVSRQTDPAMSPTAVIALLFCTGILGGFFGGRWRLFARACCGALGGFSITLLLVASIHLTSLLARAILTAFLTLIGTILAVIPYTIKSLSIFSSFIGAWLLFVGIDLFIHIDFVDLPGIVFTHFGASNLGITDVIVLKWSDPKWKGCLAGWWLITFVGSTWQWYWGGEVEGEQTWDAYLSSIISTGEAPHSSLGTFTPPSSLFSRLFSWTNSKPPTPRFTNLPGGFNKSRRAPWDDEESEVTGARVWAEDESDSDSGSDEEIVKKATRKKRSSRAREEEVELELVPQLSSSKPAKYGALSDDDDHDDDDDDDDDRTMRSRRKRSSSGTVSFLPAKPRPILRNSQSSSSGMSGNTLVSSTQGNRIDRKGTASRAVLSQSSRDRTKSSDSDKSVDTTKKGDKLAVMPSIEDGEIQEFADPIPVPATPSLIKAIDRINAAQKQARAEVDRPKIIEEEQEEEGSVDRAGAALKPRPSINDRSRKASYDDWWAKVVRKSGGK